MPLMIQRPTVSSRRKTGTPQPAPVFGFPPALRAVSRAPLPVPSIRVTPPPGFHRREVPRAPVLRLVAPALRLPPPRPPVRAPEVFVLPAEFVPPQPVTLALSGPAGMRAVYVGITGGLGTVVSASPADLTQGPVTDITNFRVSIDSGSW
jgi:hypothetical protein